MRPSLDLRSRGSTLSLSVVTIFSTRAGSLHGSRDRRQMQMHKT